MISALKTKCCLCSKSMTEHEAHLFIDNDGVEWLNGHCSYNGLTDHLHMIHKYHSLSEASYQEYLGEFR